MPSSRKRTHVSSNKDDGPAKELRAVTTDAEIVHEDDICSICNLLLLNPVTTSCGHTFCESCFSHWADISLSTNRLEIGLDVDEDVDLPPNEIEAKCPMCRTLSTAVLDQQRSDLLTQRYPSTYETRSNELLREQDEDGTLVEPVTIWLGNEHAATRREPGGTANVHSWRFFIRFSRNDIIEEVHVFLHPTFRQNHIILTRPPFDLRRLGWGTFTISVAVLLRGGWSWISSDAEDSPDGAVKGKLPLQWDLDFRGRGTQARFKLKVKRQKEDQLHDDERHSETIRRLWNRQRETDPDYIPPDDD